MALLGLIVLAFVLTVNASLSTNYPVNAQLPPVARVSEPFEFVFSAGTFGGADTETKYSLEDAPLWLGVKSKSRTLSGTPQSDDVGEQKFNLVADGPSGFARMEVTLVVSVDDGPKPGKPLLPQLEKYCPASAPSTAFVRPGDSFSISFDKDTFADTGNSTVYYGTSPENSPLPSWVRFDPDDLRFSGTTPKGGPQSFTFNLVASDVLGFSAATYAFELAVRPHILSFNDTIQTLTLTRGDKFESPAFHEFLTLDGRNPTEEDLTDVSIEGPGWITLDNKTLTLSGTPPSNAAKENITISITDTNEDVAKMVVSLDYSQLFLDGVAGCDATIGEDFSYVFDQSVLTDDSAHLEINSQLPSWLHYDAKNKKLYGHVPADANAQKHVIDLTATKGSTEDTRKFTVDVAEAGHHDHSDTDKTVESGSATGTGGDSHRKRAGIIAIAVIIPCVFVASVIVIFFCWRRKRKEGVTHDEGDWPTEKASPPGLDSQPPLPQCQPLEDSISHSMPPPAQSPPPPSPPPKLELKPFFDANTFEKTDAFVTEQPVEDAAADKENTRPRSTVGWDFSSLNEPEQGRRSEDVMAKDKRRSLQGSPSFRRQTSQSKRREPLKPIQARRSLKRNSAASSRSKRLSKRSSGLSSVASGLPVRLSGAGHGAGGFGPPGHGVVRMSWQNTRASLQSDEGGLGNLAPLFPRPPPRARERIEYARRASMRALGREDSTISESDTLEAFVHSRAKSRNSTNPMFSGQSNRRTSSGLRALERKRSTLSRADTESTANFTTYGPDDHRQWLQERPYSTARSASIYTDDNRQSTYLQPASRMSYMQASPAGYPSQSSLAQNYRDVLSPLPHFMTEASLAHGGRRLEDVEEQASMVHRESHYAGGRHGERPSGLYRRSSSCYDWRRTSTYTTEEEITWGRLQKIPSLPLDDPRGGRMSSLWSADVDKENEPMDMPREREETWQTMSAEDSQEFPRDQTRSSYGAFL